ncbi:MAG: ribosome recycling factor [Clostridia bacterium]|nr:ribosome recycling factor [Clostridia bacterium]
MINYKEFEEKMKKSVSVFVENLGSIRAGRANPKILNNIQVEYYGTSTPITQVASVSVPEARLIVVQPWDKSVLGEIEKAIQKADLGINPINDGNVIRLNFPELNEERRKEIVKEIKTLTEEAKVSIRNIRRDSMELVKDLEKKSEISEDELKVAENEVQKLTDKYNKEIDNEFDKKQKEILSI